MPPQQSARASSSGNLRAQQRQDGGSQRRPARSSSYNMGDSNVSASGERPADSSPGLSARHRSLGSVTNAAQRSAAKAPEAQEPEADLLDLSGPAERSAAPEAPQPSRAASQPSRAASSVPPVPPPHEDLLNMSDVAPSPASKTEAGNGNARAAPAAAPAVADDGDDLLGGFAQAQPAVSAARQQPASRQSKNADIEALFGAQPASNHRAGTSMIDFGDEAAPEAARVFADPGDADVEGEPEVSNPPCTQKQLATCSHFERICAVSRSEAVSLQRQRKALGWLQECQA